MNPGYKTKHLLAASLLSLLLGASSVQADNLANALEQAWARHPRAAALPAHAEVARASGELAAALTPGPATLSLNHLNDQVGADQGKRDWEIELATPLWLPGQKHAHAAEAASQSAEIDTQRAALRLDLAGELRSAWWALAAARQTQDLVRGRLNSVRAMEGDVLRRYRAGDLARVDANLARAATLAAQDESLQAETAAREAELAWQALTAHAGPDRLPPEVLPDRQADIAGHPRLVALAGALRTARARLGVAQANRRDAPELAVRLLRERGDRSESYGNAVGIKLSIPFGSDARQRLATADERAEILRQEAELAQIRQRMQSTLEQAWFELDMTEQQHSLARTRHELASDTLALAEKAFRLGESDLSMLLRARAASFDAETRLKQQELARGKAISRLKQALGQMP